MNLYQFISDTLKEKLAAVLPPLLGGAVSEADWGGLLSSISVETPKNRDFGDFATNAAMILAKPLKQNPRVIADTILPHISALPFVSDASIAGPGFINIKLKDEFILESVNSSNFKPQTSNLVIDIDYGGYNVAKALHIGHLRTSIVGDTFNRIAKFLGYQTKSYSYIGDWGRPMGLIIAWIETLHPDWPFFKEPFDKGIDLSPYQITPADLDTFYPAASARAKADPDFLAHAQQITKEFQDGRPGYTALYNIFLKTSLDMMDDAIRRMNIMPFDYTLGERNASLYLDPVEKILRDKNLLVKDDGAEIIVLKTAADTAPMPPLMFFNSRGADTYESTDLATIYFRKIKDNPDRMIYITDARQSLHFEQIFRAAILMDLFRPDQLEHIGYGTINGADGRPFKTRDGGVPSLDNMIDLVVDAARARVAESGKNLPDATIEMIALAALKFNDLMHDVKSDYIFDPDAVTQFEGRTGPYILYTAVRLNSVLKRVGANAYESASRASAKASHTNGEQSEQHSPAGVLSYAPTSHPSERELLLTILDFERVLNVAFDRRATDILANWTYDLAQAANAFYHTCPILRDDVDEATRTHRLNIVRAAMATLSTAIDLMGLQIPEEM